MAFSFVQLHWYWSRRWPRGIARSEVSSSRVVSLVSHLKNNVGPKGTWTESLAWGVWLRCHLDFNRECWFMGIDEACVLQGSLLGQELGLAHAWGWICWDGVLRPLHYCSFPVVSSRAAQCLSAGKSLPFMTYCTPTAMLRLFFFCLAICCVTSRTTTYKPKRCCALLSHITVPFLVNFHRRISQLH